MMRGQRVCCNAGNLHTDFSCSLPAFPFPKTKAFDFSKFPRKEPDAEQKLARAADMRAELAQALNVGDPARVAEAADAYLPLAVGIWRALEQGLGFRA